MARRDVLDLAVLGLLHDTPMHGYELRKRLAGVLGPFRALSFGTLYPCLRQLLDRGWVVEQHSAAQRPTSDRTGSAAAGPNVATRRGRIVYELTATGKEHFETLIAEGGPTSWDDESFGVRFSFFARTEAGVRLRILEGRRSRLEERLDTIGASVARGRERADAYTLELQRHGLESVQREVRWLSELITAERATDTTDTTTTATRKTTT